MTYVVIDIETTGLSRFKDEITAVGVYIPKYDYYEIFNKDERNKFISFMKSLHNYHEDLRFVYQNGKFDTLFLEQKWDVYLEIDEDVMLLAYVLDMGEEKSLDYLAEKHFCVETWDIPLKEKKVFTPKMVEYLKKDLYWTWKLFEKLVALLDSTSERVYRKLVLQAYRAYRCVERNGIAIDVERLEQTINEFKQKREEYKAILDGYAKINWNSNPQLSDLLFNKLHMPVLLRTDKGAPSCGAPVLKKLAKMKYPIVSELLQYKYYDKALGTFLERWKKDAVNGRIYPTFNIDTTRTGRTSCKDPNLQQVPRDVALRSLFTARPGYVLIEADQSQVELRIAAHYSQDPKMMEVYRNDGDIHTQTARAITGMETPTKEARTRAKPVNFGFIYGMSANSFVSYAETNYDVIYSLEEATQYREHFFNEYRGLEKWYTRQKNLCFDQGGVYTLFGRFRKLPDIYSRNLKDKSAAERRAINTPVQSSASDILLSGMIEIVNEFPDVYVCGTVHDSILIEVPEKLADILKVKIVKVMENPKLLDEFGIKLSVPLKVDAAIGNWGSK